MAEKERDCVPLLGVSTDRRALLQVGEVLREGQISGLLYFVCACKHVRHLGYNRYGEPTEKGSIAYPYNLDVLRSLLNGLGGDDMDTAFKYNLSYTFFKKRKFHEAVQTDPFLCEKSFEWSRTVCRKDVQELILCCPEDVEKGSECRHDDDSVCWKCKVPICNECFSCFSEDKKIQSAL